MKLPSKTLEKKLFRQGYGYVCAVDEVGMGCLAGPVVVCAVGMTSNFYKKNHKKLHWLMESKLLRANQRERYAEELMKEKDLVYSLALSSPKIIDKLNIYQAARLAMRRAVGKLVLSSKYYVLRKRKTRNTKYVMHNTKAVVLVDGPYKIVGLKIDQIPIIKGDQKVFAIACASIIAKVYRDKMMVRYAKKYPGYGFEKHKGYGTEYHKIRLAYLGPCEIHRKSFAPVAKLV